MFLNKTIFYANIFLYINRDMNQNIWGPSMWFSLHTITFNYPLEPKDIDKANYKIFLENFGNVIPCSICKKNYARHLKEHPIDKYLCNRKSFVYWMIDLHNMVNSETGKKILSYDIVIKKYEKIYNKKIILNDKTPTDEICNKDGCDITKKEILLSNEKKYTLYYIIIVLLIIILIINLVFLYGKSKN